MTSTERNIFKIELNLFGLTDLSRPEEFNRVLDEFDRDALFTPDSLSQDERKNKTYDRDWVVEEAAKRKRNFENWFYIKRRRVAKYEGAFVAGKEPYFYLAFNPKLNPKNYPKLFAFIDRVVDALRPDFASLTIVPEYQKRPWPTELDQEIAHYLYSSLSSIGDYRDNGPSGLGLYTWLSDHYIQQIGEEHLKKTPNVTITKKDWGDVRISLGPNNEPWTLDAQALVDNWRPAMEHLWQAGVFAEQYIYKEHNIKKTKAENCVIGSRIADEDWER